MSLRRTVAKKTQPAPSVGYATLQTTRGGASSTSTSLSMASGVSFDNTPLWQACSIISLVNLLGAILSLATGQQYHVDLLGAGAFGLAAVPPLLAHLTTTKGISSSSSSLLRINVSSIAVIAWSLRLATFLFMRVLKIGHDSRLDDTFSTVGGTLGFWVGSALWGIICSLPHTLGTTSSAPGNTLSLAIGSVVYLAGLLTEGVADYQKWAFKQSNPGQFCDVGLWSISQHPNYFGNLLLWSGIYIMNAPALIEPISSEGTVGLWAKVWSYRRLAWALLSPLFMGAFFAGQAHGTIGNAVEAAEAKYGDDPVFRDYVDNVPLIFPNLFKLWK